MQSECLFCKIVEGKINSNIVDQTDDWLCFHDVNPQAPVHALLIPKKHCSDIETLNDEAMFGKLFGGIKKVAKQLGLDEGYRVVTNKGEYAGQSVFHLHFHILGKRRMGWPPG